MSTLRAAGDLLATADSLERLVAIAAACGCSGAPALLDDATRRTLGLGDAIADARVAAGRGALCALMVEAADHMPLRDLLPKIAARLAARAPHCLWLVVAIQQKTGTVAIMAWTDDRRPPRIAALVANRARIVDSDAETLRALSAATGDRDVLTHARWVDVLGREALSTRFYHALERAIAGLADSSDRGARETRRELALLTASRLLFLSFLEAKGWLDGSPAFIIHHFDRCMTRGGQFHRRVLRPLFFGTLNTPAQRRAPAAKSFGRIPFLNGGLFTRTPLERRHRDVEFTDDAYGNLLATVFIPYRFTAREESTTWSEAAIDPEMLGRAFESLMGASERRRTGAFYTPFSLVDRIATSALTLAIGERPTRAELEQLTVLDPACGSGAFLVHVLERIAALRATLGDTRDPSAIRADVLTRSIYGVDVNPTAVWLCQLRLWLSVVIESGERDPSTVMPLPNLDRNVRVGDALSGRAFGPEDLHLRGASDVRRLRQRYATSSGARKEILGRHLDRAERHRAIAAFDADLAVIAERRRDLIAAQRGRDLFGERYRPSRDERNAVVDLRRRAASLRTMRRRIAAGGAFPFSFPVFFADVGLRGGFGLVIGNPPWVRLHRLTAQQRAEFRRDFEVACTAAWEPGASAAGAGSGFAAQVDVAALFVERSVRLLAPRGALALLVPVKLWRSLAGGGLRRFVASETQLHRLEDFSESVRTFDAAVYPSVVAATRCIPASSASPQVHVALHDRGSHVLEWRASLDDLAFDDSPGAPWILLPPEARAAFERLRRAGRPLAESPIGRPLLGVKSGCNDVFIGNLLGADDVIGEMRVRGGHRVTIERALLRPLLRGEHLRRWQTPAGQDVIIWTHDETGGVLAELPPHAAKWLTRWRRDLVARTDARNTIRWWSLFRTESARCDHPRVVWADVGREPRACFLRAGDPSVALNSCYVVRCANEIDAYAVAALLNGPLARSWLNAAAEPARGGYRRYLGWTMSLLPVPSDWRRARKYLAPLAARAEAPSERELLEASLAAYRLDASDVEPLIAWASE